MKTAKDDPKKFYDDLAELYHLISEDWEGDIDRQGKDLDTLIQSRWPGAKAVADVVCGIGTQALGLAKLNYEVNASDLSPVSVKRANREAASRNLDIRARVDDMCKLATHRDGSADVIINCHTSVPHLHSNDLILDAFRQAHRVLRPGGGLVISLRDFAGVPRSGDPGVLPVGFRHRGAELVYLFHIWHYKGKFIDIDLYFAFDKRDGASVFRTRLYAVTFDVLSRLLKRAGFVKIKRLNSVFFQPVIIATRPGP